MSFCWPEILKLTGARDLENYWNTSVKLTVSRFELKWFCCPACLYRLVHSPKDLRETAFKLISQTENAHRHTCTQTHTCVYAHTNTHT